MALIKKHSAGGKADFKKHVAEQLLTDESLSAREQELISKGLDTFDPENLGNDSEDKRSIFGKVRDEDTANTWLKDQYKSYSEKNATEIDISPEGGWKHERDIGDIFDHIVKEDYGGNEDSAFRSLGEMADNNKIKQYAIKKAKNLVGSYVSRANQEAVNSPNNIWHKKEEAEALQNVLFGIDESKEINDDDWNKVLDFSNKLGWNLGDMTRSPQELEDIEKLKKEKERKEFLEKSENQLKGLNLDEDTVLQLSGYTLADDDYEPLEDLPFLQDLLKKNGYNLIQSEDKKTHALVKDGKIVTDAGGLISDDQLSDHFGKTWGISNGALTIFDKDQMDINTAFDKSKVGEDKFNRNIGRQILTTDPDFEGYKIIGYSGDDYRGGYDKDEFGRRRFTKEFKFIKDGKEFKVIRGEDGVYRKDGETKEFKMPKGLSYGEEVTNEIKDYNEMYFKHVGNPVSQLYGKKISNKGKKLDLEKAESELMRFEKEYKDATGVPGQEREVKLKASDAKHVGEFLKHVMTTNTYTEAQKQQAEKLLQRLSEFSSKTVFKDGQEITLFDTDLFKWKEGGVIEKIEEKKEIPFDMVKFEKWKNGGVIKSASGGSTQDYLATVSKLAEGREKLPEDASGSPHPTGYHDPTGTMADANLLDWISTGASVASFVPVLGVAGGVVSTLADAANAAVRGEWTRGDTMNLLSNIGFTALAGVGLGAAKGVKMGAKVGKVVGKGKKAGAFTKLVGKVGKTSAKAKNAVKSVGKSTILTQKASVALKRAENLGDKKTLDAAKRLMKVAKKGDSKTLNLLLTGKASPQALKAAGYAKKADLISDLNAVNKMSAVKTTWYGQTGQGIAKGVKQIATLAPTVIGKGVKYGLGAAQIGGGIKGGITIAGNVKEEGNLWEGIKKSQMSDIRNVLQTSALGYGYRQNKLNAKAVKNRTKTIYSEASESKLNLYDKEGNIINTFKVTKDVDSNDFNPTWWGKVKNAASFNKTKAKGTSYNKKDLDEVKKEISNLVSEKDFNKISEALDSGAIPKINTKRGTPVTTVIKDLTSNDPKEIRETIRAQKVLKRGSTNYFRHGGERQVQTESQYNASVGKIAPGSKVKTDTPALGKGKAKRSSKPMPRKLRKDYQNTAKYKNASKSQQKVMDNAFKRQQNAEKWLKKKKANKSSGKTKLSVGGVIKHNNGYKIFPNKPTYLNFDFTNTGWNPSNFEQRPSKVSAAQVSTQGLGKPVSASPGPEIQNYTPITSKPLRVGEPFVDKHGNVYGDRYYYRRPLRKHKGVGEPWEFDFSYEAFRKRQLREAQTTESGIYLGKEEPKYSLYGNNVVQKNPLADVKEYKSTVEQYDHTPFNRKPIRNYGPGLEWLRKTISNRANMESTLLAQRAASKYGTKTGLKTQHLRTSSPYESFARDQAGQMRSLGSRLATASSDIERGNLAQLDAESRAQGTILQGRAGDLQRNDQIRNQQQQINARTNEYNTNVVDFNRDAEARSEAAQLQLGAQERLQRGLNDGAWVAGVTKELADKPRRDLFNRYVTEIQDPNIQGMQQYYQDKTSTEAIAERKRQWDIYQEDLKKAEPTHKKVEYEDSEDYANYMKEVKKQVAPMQQKMGMLANISNLLAVYGGGAEK